MPTNRFAFVSMLIMASAMLLAGCGPGQFLGPTVTPTSTDTPIPTATSTPTLTLTPTATQVPPTATPTETPIPLTLKPNAVNGTWHGTTSQGGKFQFQVKSGAFISVDIEINQPGCESITPISAFLGNTPQPVTNPFSIDLLVATMTGSFSAGVVSGSMDYKFGTDCEGNLTFTGTR
jgi:hypothetical protein